MTNDTYVSRLKHSEKVDLLKLLLLDLNTDILEKVLDDTLPEAFKEELGDMWADREIEDHP